MNNGRGNNSETIKKNNVPLRLTLPPEAVERLTKAGIRCTPEVTGVPESGRTVCSPSPRIRRRY